MRVFLRVFLMVFFEGFLRVLIFKGCSEVSKLGMKRPGISIGKSLLATFDKR